MDSYKIIITPDAETDLFEIRDYIAYTLLVPDVALNYIRAIRSEIQKLTYMASNIAPIEREPWHSRGVRKITAKNFYIYYRTDDSSGRVYILNALLGITEPAMFGVNLRLKRPMICACIAGAIGSAVAGFFGCRAVSFALPALTTLSLFMGHAFVPFLASLAVSFGLAFLFTMAVTIPDLQ